MSGDPHDSLRYRRALVATLRHHDHLHSARVAEALLAVPREAFVPGLGLDEVYRPADAIVTKRVEGVTVSSASAPEVIALMLEQLDPQPGQRVLEIGAGTGYNAALLAYLVGERGHVVSIDIDEDLVLGAREHLGSIGFAERVEVVQGDGALGYPGAAPYDRIILTVASGDIAPAWHEQLARDGRLVMPLALRGLQRCVGFVREPDADCLVSRSPRNCSFIGLRGLLGMSVPHVRRTADGTWALPTGDDGLPLPAEVLGEALSRPMIEVLTQVTSSLDELRQGLQLWLCLHEANVRTLWGTAGVPDLFGLGAPHGGLSGTLCLADADGSRVALLAWADEGLPSGELCVLASPGAEALADRLRSLIVEWAEAGRPGDADAELRAYSRGGGPAAAPGEVVIDQRWTRFVISWTTRRPA